MDQRDKNGKRTPAFNSKAISQNDSGILDSVGLESDERRILPPNQTNHVTKAWVTQTGFNTNGSKYSIAPVEALNSGRSNSGQQDNLSPT